MIVKSFIADSVAGALKIVRSELGGDAVILKTRKLDIGQQRTMGGKIEVTACVDGSPKTTPVTSIAETSPAPAPVRTTPVPWDSVTQKLDFLIDVFQSPARSRTFPGSLGRVFAALLAADMPEKMVCETIERLSGRYGAGDDYSAVALGAAELLERQLPRPKSGDQFTTGEKILFTGPPGAGKTSLMARLAGFLVVEKKLPVCLTSLDQVKPTAPEELQTSAAALDVDHFQMPYQVDRSLLDRQGKDKVTLIDTPATHPRNQDSVSILAEKIDRLRPNRIIGVFPALCRAGDLLDIIRIFKPFRLTELAITMTDQTERWGAMIAASIQTGLPISILGTGQQAGAIDLSPDPEKIIRSILNLREETGHE